MIEKMSRGLPVGAVLAILALTLTSACLADREKPLVRTGNAPQRKGPAIAESPASRPHSKNRPIIVIDPGHQMKADLRPEPVAPGSAAMKPRVAGGAIGVVTGVSEYSLTLDVSKRIATKLEAKGVTVFMTRTENNASISNRERAETANRARAALFIRVHADSSGDPRISGASTLYQANSYSSSDTAQNGFAAARHIQQALVQATGQTDRGTIPRTDLAGFNWARVPAILVEIGFLSNPQEDRRLQTEELRAKIAEGIAKGALTYLGID